MAAEVDDDSVSDGEDEINEYIAMYIPDSVGDVCRADTGKINDAVITSVRSAIMVTMCVQAVIILSLGILVHCLAGTCISTEKLVTIGMWTLGAHMYIIVIEVLAWVVRLYVIRSSQPPSISRTDPEAILQCDTTDEIVETLSLPTIILHHFHFHNQICYAVSACVIVFVILLELLISSGKSLDVLQFPIILGLVAVGSLLVCYSHNYVALREYEKRLTNNSALIILNDIVLGNFENRSTDDISLEVCNKIVLGKYGARLTSALNVYTDIVFGKVKNFSASIESRIRGGTLPVGDDETVTFETLPASLNGIIPTPDAI